MNLTVKGKNIDVGEAFRTYIAENLDTVFSKYFGKPIEATVTMSKQAHLFHAQLQAHVGRGILLQSEAAADQPYAAYDLASEHLAKRLRRHKRRLSDHNRDEAMEVVRQAQYMVLAPIEENEDETANGAAAGAGHEAEPATIVAEMQTEVPSLTVSEAVMRLDLSDQQAMMFLNRAHGGLNMIYRRNDGHIGWVDPQLSQG